METDTPPPSPLAPGITGVVLTDNGERLLEKCLASLSFCDALLVVDRGGADATLAIAQRHNAVLVRREREGLDALYAFAQTQVRTRWLFSLDQDEMCPPSLAVLITRAIATADADADTPAATPVAFSVGRKSWYVDRFMRHGGWYPNPVPRVFRTGFVEFYQAAHLHFRPLGTQDHIGGPGAEIIHYPYDSFFEQMEKLNLYAEQGAAALRASGCRGGVLQGIGHGFARFFRIYVLKKGFLDGRAGFLAACHGSFYAFMKYVRVPYAPWGKPFDGQ